MLNYFRQLSKDNEKRHNLSSVVNTHIISTANSDVERQQLKWDNWQDSLETVHSLWYLKSSEGKSFHFIITFITNNYGTALQMKENHQSVQ